MKKTGGSKNPRAWSEQHKTPILCLVPDNEYLEAKSAFATLNSNTANESEIRSALAFLESATFFDKLSDQSYCDQLFVKKIVGDYAHLLTDIQKIRDVLDSIAIDVYEWSDNPAVRAKIKNMAIAEYNAGGSDIAISAINGMSDDQLRQWLKELAMKDVDLGVKIILNGGQ